MIDPITADEMQGAYTAAHASLQSYIQPESPRVFAEQYASKRGFPKREFFGPHRTFDIAHARQDCWREMQARYDLGLSDIGRMFSRDHTTVSWGIERSAARAAQ